MPTPMSSSHLDTLLAIFSELYEVNDRLLVGDIYSPKTALPRVRKMLDHYRVLLEAEGATEIVFDPFIAAGGRIGLRYDYKFEGQPVAGCSIPCRQ